MMRCLTVLTTLLLTACCAVAQQVQVAGTIMNRASDTVIITYNSSRLAYYPKRYYAVLDKKNHFSVALPVPAGVYTPAEVLHGNHLTDLLLQPGDSLTLQADANHFDSTVRYTGRGAAVQNFIAGHTLARGRMNQYPLKVRQAVTEAMPAFIKTLEDETRAEMAYLRAHGGGVPGSFARYWEAFYKYYNYFFMQQYPQMHEMAVKRHYTDTIPQGNYEVMARMPETYNDSFLQVPPYLLYLTGAVEAKLKAAGLAPKPGDTLGAQRLQDSVYKLTYTRLPEGSAAYYVAQNLYARARLQYIGRTRTQMAAFEQRWPASEYLPLLRQQVAIAERTAPGMPAPDVAVAMADGRTVRLADLKDTVVLLHFWATWCRQCVGEIRGEKKLREILKGKPVVFAYLSMDEDTATAIPLQQKLAPDIKTTYLKGMWDAAEVQAYGVQTLPAYYLIDKQGNFGARTLPSPAQTMDMMVAISKLL